MSDVLETTSAAPREPHAGAAVVLRIMQAAHPEDAAAIRQWLDLYGKQTEAMNQAKALADTLIRERQDKLQEMNDSIELYRSKLAELDTTRPGGVPASLVPQVLPLARTIKGYVDQWVETLEQAEAVRRFAESKAEFEPASESDETEL